MIRRPSIKPSPESDSIYVPIDPAPVRVPPLRTRGLLALCPRDAVSMEAKEVGQTSKVGSFTDSEAADTLVESVFHV
jgi:hypothetical protein